MNLPFGSGQVANLGKQSYTLKSCMYEVNETEENIVFEFLICNKKRPG